VEKMKTFANNIYDKKNILKMGNITKTFPGVKALDHARLDVYEGEVHALMGENGAGKSTFMKILNGLLQPDEGDIYFCGEKIYIHSPAEALKLGIAMIYQELNPIRDMTISENIFLGREKAYAGIFVDKKGNNKEAAELLAKFGLTIHPNKPMSVLSLAQMQMVEIIKAVSVGAKLIVMDEPTSSLTEEEIRIFFATIQELKKKGVAIIYITHRLEEVFTIADTVTVLRDGKYIDTRAIEELDKDILIGLMVGRTLDTIYPKVEVPIRDTVLKVESLGRKDVFSDISFEVKKGEILGFYGLIGAGRSEVFRCIFGLDRYDRGQIFLDGQLLAIRSVSQSISSGIVMVTEDRKDTGLVLCRSIRENLALPNLNSFTTHIIIDNKLESEVCLGMAEKLTVKMSSLSQEAGSLSGGNQQKIVLAKWIMKSPDLLILDEPTRGIDVGAKAEIHSLMVDFAAQGMAIVMISSELPEILGMSDRVIVMREGRIKGEYRIGQYSQDEILQCAIGGKSEDAV
jgi:ABC-type sugar transport system ATPase subunit